MSRSHRSIPLLAATLLSASAGLYAAGNADTAPATNAEAQQIRAPDFTPRTFERYTVFTRQR